MDNKYKILALFGKSGSGKDTIKRWVESEFNVNVIVPYTTRPKRDYEINKYDYNFISKEDFEDNKDSFFTVAIFNKWIYGNSFNGLDKNKINIGVFSINDIKQIIACDKIEVFPILVKAFDNIRLVRCVSREEYPDCHEICRRFLADEKDFENINFMHECYENSFGTKKDFLDFIKYNKKINSFLRE